MTEIRIGEMREALLALLSTGVSMGSAAQAPRPRRLGRCVKGGAECYVALNRSLVVLMSFGYCWSKCHQWA